MQIFDLHNVVKELKLDLKKAISQASQETVNDNRAIKDDYQALKVQLKTVMAHLENKPDKKEPPVLVKQMLEAMDEFLKEIEADSVEKGLIEEQVNSWKKLLQQIEEKGNCTFIARKLCFEGFYVDPDAVLKNQYKESVENLHAFEAQVKDLQAVAQSLTEELSEKTEENCHLKTELDECVQQLQSAHVLKENLEKKLNEMGTALKKRDTELTALKTQKDKDQGLGKLAVQINYLLSNILKKLESLGKAVDLLRKQLKRKEQEVVEATQAIERYEQEQREVKKWMDNMKEDINNLRSKNEQLELEVNEGKNAMRSLTDVKTQKDIFSREGGYER